MSWTRNELTATAVKRYIESGGAHCPRCGSTDIEAGRMQAERGVVTGDVQCFVCHARWRSVYTLSAIDVLDGQGCHRQTVATVDSATSTPQSLDAMLAMIEARAGAACKPESTLRDLGEIVRAAWRVMTPAQRTTLLREREVAALAMADGRNRHCARDSFLA